MTWRFAVRFVAALAIGFGAVFTAPGVAAAGESLERKPAQTVDVDRPTPPGLAADHRGEDKTLPTLPTVASAHAPLPSATDATDTIEPQPDATLSDTASAADSTSTVDTSLPDPAPAAAEPEPAEPSATESSVVEAEPPATSVTESQPATPSVTESEPAAGDATDGGADAVPAETAMLEARDTVAVEGISAQPHQLRATPEVAPSESDGAPAPLQVSPQPRPTVRELGIGLGRSVLIECEPGMVGSSQPVDNATTSDAHPMVVVGGGVAAVAPRVSTTVAVAMDFARLSGGWAGPLVFNLWLRRQLRERRLTQRQLAAMSSVNHSTISRLVNGGRTPSLETAAKLVHALRLEWTDEQVATYFDLLPERTLFPTQRVESALRGDPDLDEADVRAIMEQYLVTRSAKRASGRASRSAGHGSASGGGGGRRAGP